MKTASFHRQMCEAKSVRRAELNRGVSIGDHGMRPLTKAERAAVDSCDEIEIGIAQIVGRLTAWRAAFANDLLWSVREINDPTIYDFVPF